jgi:hypothetical protein
MSSKSSYERKPQPTQVRVEFLMDKVAHTWIAEQAKANGATLSQLVQELIVRGIQASAQVSAPAADDSVSPPAP